MGRHAAEESFLESEEDQDGAGMQMIALGNAVHSLSAAMLKAVPLPDAVNWQ